MHAQNSSSYGGRNHSSPPAVVPLHVSDESGTHGPAKQGSSGFQLAISSEAQWLHACSMVGEHDGAEVRKNGSMPAPYAVEKRKRQASEVGNHSAHCD